MLMSYVLRTGYRGHNLDELSSDYLSHVTKKFSDVTTVKKKKYALVKLISMLPKIMQLRTQTLLLDYGKF